MENKLVITKHEEKIISALIKDREMIQVSIDNINQDNILGNIYVGKVTNIVKNINAAFIEIDNNIIGYYSLKENNKNIRIGDELIVQVTKEAIKTKGPVLSSNIELIGKYIILIYNKPIVSISSKIQDVKRKKQLKEIVSTYLTDEYGFIIRTNSINASDEMIINEIEILINYFNQINNYSGFKKTFSLIYEGPCNYISHIRDGYSDLIDKIVTDDEGIFNKIFDYLSTYQKEDLVKLKLYKDDFISLNSFYGIKTKLNEALQKSVWLKSGASIVIQHTEALTAIDVNTGKAISGKKPIEDTFLKINLEAAKEIGKQIRLRNLSGIIIVDFIDMKLKENKEILLKEFNKILLQDPTKTTLIDMTALGLVEITRKKVRKPLYEQVYNVN